MKNPFPVVFLILLALALAYGFFSIWGGFSPVPQHKPGPAASPPACMDGQTQYCVVGNCSGLSTCLGGSWGGCKWARICNPGSKTTCLKDNCPYALKECDGCGTGYGPCIGINGSGG